jgi:hypothetical protein
MEDFDLALEEVKPQFGVDFNNLDVLVRRGIVNYGKRFS